MMASAIAPRIASVTRPRAGDNLNCKSWLDPHSTAPQKPCTSTSACESPEGTMTLESRSRSCQFIGR